MAAASVPDRSVTPVIISDDEEQPLRRQKACVTFADAPPDADMVTVGDEHYVRDDIIAQWK